MKPEVSAAENSRRWMRVYGQVEDMLVGVDRDRVRPEDDLLVQDIQAMLYMIMVADEEHQMSDEDNSAVLRAMVRSIEALWLLVLQRSQETHPHLHDQIHIEWNDKHIPSGIWTLPATVSDL